MLATSMSPPYPRTMRFTKDRATGCLLCGNEEGRFESEEHIIPVSLGNTIVSGLVERELVIPPGETCDKCNHKRLSARDAALAAWPPVSVFRSLAQIRNRRGDLVDAVAKTRWSLKLDDDDPRLFKLQAEASTSDKSGRDQVARALCKIALETRWLEDPEDARSSRWDAVAAAAIGGPLPTGLAMGLTQPRGIHDIDLTPSVDVRAFGDAEELVVASQIWVVGLGLNLVIGAAPPPLENTAWWELDPRTGSLQGPNSMWARFSGGAGSATRLRAPGPEASSSRSSRLPTHDERVHLRLQPSQRDPR